MIKATDWARDLQSNVVVTAFTADEDADTSNLPVNDPATGVNEKYGKIEIGCTASCIRSSGLEIYKYRESTNDWIQI